MSDFRVPSIKTARPAFEVRTARMSDAAGIAAVHIASWEGAYRGLIPDEFLDHRTLARQTARWEEVLGPAGDGIDRSRPWVAVAERDGVTIGFVSLGVPRGADSGGSTAEITALYVEPPAWRGGVGTALMEAALAEAEACGCADVALWVLEPNLRARAFYEHFGFADDGARQRNGEGWPLELRMRCAL